MAAGHDIDYLFRRALPDALDPIVHGIVGDRIPRDETGRFRVAHTGRFSNRCAGDLLAFCRNQRLDGALLVVEADTARALHFRGGRAVGAESDVLFERLGRLLRRCGVVDEATAAGLVDREEQFGLVTAAQGLSPEVSAWALETRVYDVAASLFFVAGGHFVIVEGAPDLGALPPVEVSPTDLALEGLRRYDEWRNGTTSPPRPSHKPAPAPPPPPAQPVAPASAVDELLERLRALE